MELIIHPHIQYSLKRRSMPFVYKIEWNWLNLQCANILINKWHRSLFSYCIHKLPRPSQLLYLECLGKTNDSNLECGENPVTIVNIPQRLIVNFNYSDKNSIYVVYCNVIITKMLRLNMELLLSTNQLYSHQTFTVFCPHSYMCMQDRYNMLNNEITFYNFFVIKTIIFRKSSFTLHYFGSEGMYIKLPM